MDVFFALCEIGRVIAAEIEKVFEAKVSPMTVTMRASRIQSVTNVTPAENPEPPTVKAGDSGDNQPRPPRPTPRPVKPNFRHRPRQWGRAGIFF